MSRTRRLMPYTWNWISGMDPSDGGFLRYYHKRLFPTGPGRARSRARSRADSGQRPLIAVPLDSFQLALEAPQAGGRIVVLVAGIGQVPADHVEGLAELVQVPPQPAEAGLDLLGIALDPEAPEPHDDHPQVGVEGVGRDRHHPAPQGIGGGGLLLAVLLHHDLVVDVLGPDVHQGEVESD